MAEQFRSLRSEDVEALGVFFESIRPDEAFFHPHALTREEAATLCGRIGSVSDEYVVAESATEIVAYGMLRGWDEGYEIPSLGIAVHPALRGAGLGRRMMLHLQEIAAARGAPSVRLKVYVTNTPAVALYRSLGYVFERVNDDELLGLLPLG